MMRISHRMSIVALCLAMCVNDLNCAAEESADNQKRTGNVERDKAAFGRWGIETEHISKTLKPGDDFFSYVNEGWLKTTKIPPGYWDYGQSSVLGAQTDARVREIVLAAATANAADGTVQQQVGDLYNSFIDTERIEQIGLSAIQKDLDSILAIKNHDEVARWMADPRSSSMVAINVFPDAGNTKRWLVHLDQSNLVQPILGFSRQDYYLHDDGAYPQDRAAYIDYVMKLFTAVGIDNSTARAADLLALETKLAGLQWDFEELRDRRANYHLLTREELRAYAPGFPWDTLLAARQVADVREIVLGTDTAVVGQSKVFSETPVDHWISYLAFHWLQNQIDMLPSTLRQLSFEFYGKRLSGQKVDTPRTDRAITFVNSKIPQAVGKLYTERYFSNEDRQAATELFDYMRSAFAKSLSTADWMDAATRTEAQTKLAAFQFKVGYPKIWRDYSGVTVRKDDLLDNALRLQQSDWAYARSFLQTASDKEAWFQSPQVVDASYSVLMNAVELPAAYLQPPYFDPHADAAVNFGAIAAIIGHEMGHGFDDQGALFDGSGRLRNWWTESARQRFHERTNVLVGQYNDFSPIKGLHLNGRATLGENIGDLTGVSLAYRAYQAYLSDHPEQANITLDGFTNDQRFFLSWAQAWPYLAPDSAIRHIITYGYHSPAPYRVNGVVRNIDAWYKAFDVQPNEKMYLQPSDRVRLW